RRLACDAAVSRVIVNGPSQILDAGRATRTVTPAQRRALVVRDGGCVGCRAPAAWCEAHHIVPWAVGGLTDLSNLTLLCSVCHGNVHERRWRLAREPDGRWRLHPPDRQ
ncbi:MAG: HNH endonuclease, partial [Egibacteraceae bacterium]